MGKSVLGLLALLLFCSCKETKEQRISCLVNEWEGKEVAYPCDMVLTKYGQDTIEYGLPESDYTLVSYVDSIGCTSCKLQLEKWKAFIVEVDSLTGGSVAFLFVFHPKKSKEISLILRRDKFDRPVFVDEKGTFDALNHFPSDMAFQTFLLNKESRIVCIGNPIHNSDVKHLFLQMITGQKTGLSSTAQTAVSLNKLTDEMGDFDWMTPRRVDFTLQNIGKEWLIIEDVNTSCGCTSVSYSKEPVQPGKSLTLSVTYKAEHLEHFDKTITIYCNAASSPIRLRIIGNALENEKE